MSNKGFTLIELVMVIAILAILAAAAMPTIFGLTEGAYKAEEQGVVGNIKTALAMFGAKRMVTTGKEAYPISLDGCPFNYVCIQTTCPCFQGPLFNQVKIPKASMWKKINDTRYQHIPNNHTYGYSSATGSFDKL